MSKLLLSAFFISIMSSSAAAKSDLSGKISIDGSSTVAPITEAVAEEFRNEAPRIRVSVGISGTGGGFKKFAAGETDINDASRPIKEKEIKVAKANGIKYLELPVAFDGISVVVSRNNKLSEVTAEQLKKIWTPVAAEQINSWKEIDSKLTDRKVKLFGPGPDSGTFDFFTEEILGKSALSRGDYSSSEDDNVIVKGISADKDSLGYFGYAYFLENKSKLKALKIDGIAPNEKTIADGSYPLSRKIFIYVSSKSAVRPEVDAFVSFYLENAGKLASEVGYLPLPKSQYAQAKKEFALFVKESKKTANQGKKGTM